MTTSMSDTMTTNAPTTAINARTSNRWQTAARLLLGTLLVVFAANGLLGLVTMPPGQGPTLRFLQALQGIGYFFPLLHGVQLVLGGLLLARRLVPLALVALAPIVLNVLLFHLFLAPEGLGVAAVLLVIYLTTAYAHRHALAGLRRRSGGRLRFVLAVVFLLSGVAGLIGKTPAPVSEFMVAMQEISYVFPLVAAVQLVAGALLLLGFVPLALAMLAPLLVHILAYRLTVIAATPGMLGVTLALVALAGWLAWLNRSAWRPLWAARP